MGRFFKIISFLRLASSAFFMAKNFFKSTVVFPAPVGFLIPNFFFVGLVSLVVSGLVFWFCTLSGRFWSLVIFPWFSGSGGFVRFGSARGGLTPMVVCRAGGFGGLVFIFFGFCGFILDFVGFVGGLVLLGIIFSWFVFGLVGFVGLSFLWVLVSGFWVGLLLVGLAQGMVCCLCLIVFIFPALLVSIVLVGVVGGGFTVVGAGWVGWFCSG